MGACSGQGTVWLLWGPEEVEMWPTPSYTASSWKWGITFQLSLAWRLLSPSLTQILSSWATSWRKSVRRVLGRCCHTDGPFWSSQDSGGWPGTVVQAGSPSRAEPRCAEWSSVEEVGSTECTDSRLVRQMHHISMSVDTRDSRASRPKHTAWTKGAWWGREAGSGPSTENVSDSMTVMNTSFLPPSPSLGPTLPWLTVEGMNEESGGGGRQSELAGTPVGEGDMKTAPEPGASCRPRGGPAKSQPGSLFLHPLLQAPWRSDLQVLSRPTLQEAWGGFWGERTALKLRKHLVCFGQLDLGEKMPPSLPVAQGVWTRFFSWGWKLCFSPNPDQSSYLLKISKSCHISSVFVAKYPSPPRQV